MAESTLSLTLTQLRGECGYYLGFGPTYSSYSSAQQAVVDRCVQSGIRRFYYPLTPSGEIYEWSFMRPVTTLSLSANDADYDLPDNFGGLDNEALTFATSDNRLGPIKVVGEALIRRMQEGGTSTGHPRICAVRPKAGTPVSASSEGQRWEMLFWPTPDGSYTLTYRYTILPDILDSNLPYHLGGMQHSETVRACILATAEESLNDGQAMWKTISAERMKASIDLDKSKYRRTNFGYNGDNSDMAIIWPREEQQATYNGVAIS